MWFKKNKKEEVKEEVKDESMSKIIDEVLSEKAAEKEAAMKESAEDNGAPAAESQNGTQSIAGLIEAFIANKNNDTYKAVLDAVFPATLFVPVTPVSENKDEKTKQFAPALVQSPEGEKLFPMFSDKSQIPEEYGKQFSTVNMPFGAACDLTAKIPECDKIIVNPFTKPFIVNKELIDNVNKAVAEQREKNREMVEFSIPEPEVKATAEKIAVWFGEQPEIKQAYFSKMKQKERVSYVFIIDCPAEVQKEVFERTIEHFKAEKIALPIALIPYKGVEKVVEESKHIERVY